MTEVSSSSLSLSTNSSDNNLFCSVCFDSSLQSNNSLLSICFKTNKLICLDCFNGYCNSLIQGIFPGTCPTLICPFCKLNNCLISNNDYNLLSETFKLNYLTLAKSILSIQCGSCHKRSSLFIEQSFNDTINSFFISKLGEESFNSLKLLLKNYELGLIPINEAFDLLCSNFFHEFTLTNDNSPWGTMKNVLSLIDNPERRANIHLR